MSSKDSSENTKEEARKALAALDEKRKALELEAEAITDELMATPPDGGEPMGIDTPLVDRDGYPRADIDVYRARTFRGRLAVIKTDHSQLMKQLNEGLVTVSSLSGIKSSTAEHDKAEMAARRARKPKPKRDPITGKWVVKNWDGTVAGVTGGDQRSFDSVGSSSENVTESALPATQTSRERSSTTTHPPFCMIDAVAPDSPAAQAGLKEGDLVVEFGTINHTNHRDLMAIAELVPIAAGEQRGISITVQRSRAEDRSSSVPKTLTLVPRPWGGRGLSGCHIVKYSSETA